VVADDGSFSSPTLGRAEGWHHTFETPGRFDYHLSEQPSAKGRIVVVEP
jgi:plastocyanin